MRDFSVIVGATGSSSHNKYCGLPFCLKSWGSASLLEQHILINEALFVLSWNSIFCSFEASISICSVFENETCSVGCLYVLTFDIVQEIVHPNSTKRKDLQKERKEITVLLVWKGTWKFLLKLLLSVHNYAAVKRILEVTWALRWLFCEKKANQKTKLVHLREFQFFGEPLLLICYM